MEQEISKDIQWTWHEIFAQLASVLNYKLFELDGNGVSVAKLITGVALLVVGYWFAGRAAREVDRRLLGRLQMDSGLRYTFQRLIFYFFLFIVTLFTLRTLNVPITIFTVVGGALAVGIGFGSQNLVNNFISGILVMVERPIRIGDFVEIDGVLGTVVNIGIRSTTIRTVANAAVIVPNTSFIEKNLTNWSYSSSVTDTIRIGVGYGSDLELLKKICLEAVDTVEGVASPAQVVVNFVDFGDNALLFDLFFDVQSSYLTSRGRIRSAIRYRLNDLFVQHKVSIPFPQRDIHIVDAPPGLLQSRNDARSN
jgi:small-conductance mechanosensitive channel